MKGNITNIPIFAALTLVVSISVITAATVMGEIQEATDDSQLDQEQLENAAGAIKIFDLGIVALNAFFYIGGIVLGSRVKTNKAFALPAFLLLGLAVWLSSELANIYYMFGQAPVLGQYASEFTVLQTFMSNFPVITLGLGSLMLLVIFSNLGGGNGKRVAV